MSTKVNANSSAISTGPDTVIPTAQAVGADPAGAAAAAQAASEPALGNPALDGYLLASTHAGVRSWTPPPTSAVWGSITGTLSAQTDLNTALAAKLPLAGGTMSGNINFAHYSAVAMTCDNGTTFPASPSTAQWFYRTDLKTLFQYQSGWQAIISYGPVTLYVDGTNGTDAVGQGYSSGAGATKTWMYVINQIPPTYGGNVLILIAGGTYIENVVIQGKSPSGNYTITLQGTLPTASVTGTATSATQYALGAAGVGAVQGTLNDTGKAWTPSALVQGASTRDYFCMVSHTSDATTQPESGANWRTYWAYAGSSATGAAWVTTTAYVSGQNADKLLRITGGTGSGQERIIDWNTATSLKIVGGWVTTPDATSTYAIYDLASAPTLNLNSLSTNDGISVVATKNVILQYLNVLNAPVNYTSLLLVAGSSATVTSCRFFTNRGVGALAFIKNSGWSNITINSCLLFELGTASIARGIQIVNASAPTADNSILNTKLYQSGTQMEIGNAGYIENSFNANNGVGNGLVLRSSPAVGISMIQGARAQLSGSIVSGAVGQNISCTTMSNILIHCNNDIRDGKSHGIQCANSGLMQAQNSPKSQINYNSGFGVLATIFGQILTQTNLTLTGNTAGDFGSDGTTLIGSTETVTVSTNTTLNGTNKNVLVSGNTTITLPTAVGISGKTFTVKKTDSALTTTTIATTSGQTIDGVAPGTLTIIYQSRTFVSDGANWLIVASYL